jgi:very-short-patch-repair endonuclease
MSVSGSTGERIAQIAAVQRGRVARRQLTAAGIGSAAVHRLIARGQLHPLSRGVFCVGHRADVELGDETAALLAVREGAALSHYSAGLLWEMITEGDGLIHLIVGQSKSARVKGVRVHRSRILGPRDLVIRKWLPVTTPARALLDLAALVSARQLELAFDRSLVARIMRRNDVIELLRRSQGHPGHGGLHALAVREGGTTITRSQAEERLLALLRAARLPEPLVNARLHGFEVDFYWPSHKLVVEIDGFQFHSSRRAFEHDRRKDAALIGAGLTVIRITWRQLESEPYAVIATIARALAR